MGWDGGCGGGRKNGQHAWVVSVYSVRAVSGMLGGVGWRLEEGWMDGWMGWVEGGVGDGWVYLLVSLG